LKSLLHLINAAEMRIDLDQSACANDFLDWMSESVQFFGIEQTFRRARPSPTHDTTLKINRVDGRFAERMQERVNRAAIERNFPPIEPRPSPNVVARSTQITFWFRKSSDELCVIVIRCSTLIRSPSREASGNVQYGTRQSANLAGTGWMLSGSGNCGISHSGPI